MGLFAKALIFGAGYALGHPQGRRQLVQLREQASQLAQDPRVTRAKDQARNVAGDQALVVKNRLTGARFRRSADTGASSAISSGIQHRAQPSVPPSPDRTDTAVATPAAETAAAADSVRVAPTTDEPKPPVPPVNRP